ncbi:MAG: hypothetical protein ACU0DT_21990, partial [Albimonas sp.]
MDTEADRVGAAGAEAGAGGPLWRDAGREALLAALAFQLECGADEPLAEAPCDRFAESAAELAARAERAAQEGGGREGGAAAPGGGGGAAPPPPPPPP